MTADPNPFWPPESDDTDRHSGAVPRGILASPAFALGAAQAALWITLGVSALRVVRGFDKIFHDFGAELPGMTIVLIQVSRFLGHFWYLAILLLLSWPLLNCGIVSVLSPRPEVVIPRRVWYFATWSVPILAAVFAMLALFVPLTGLITKLSR